MNDRRLERSFVVAPDRLVENWPVGDVRALEAADLEPLLALQPELIVLGSGASQALRAGRNNTVSGPCPARCRAAIACAVTS